MTPILPVLFLILAPAQETPQSDQEEYPIIWRYDRKDYPYDSRDKVLESRRNHLGRWKDFYNGKHIDDPSLIQIDHVISLREAHNSGGYSWCPHDRDDFADDLDNLVITHKDINREKSSYGPEDWLPKTKHEIQDDKICGYLRKFVVMKIRYALEIPERQMQFISDQNNQLGCWGDEE